MTEFPDRDSLSTARDILKELPEDELLDVLIETVKTRAESLPPSEGLKFLFSLDAALYPLQGWLSVAYGGGVHTKHRHTRYHDFSSIACAEGRESWISVAASALLPMTWRSRPEQPWWA